MILRSLRWRLVFATVLILAAVVAVIGVFSSITVKQEFNRYLLAQRHVAADSAITYLRNVDPAQLREALAYIYAQWELRTIVTDRDRRIIMRYPPELYTYEVKFPPNGGIEIRGVRDGTMEAMHLRGNRYPVAGIGDVWLLPIRLIEPRDVFRVAVDRRLLAGLALAALLAVLVILSLFRRVFAPVEALTRGARDLAMGKLDTRVDVRGEDEVAELALSFNSMAEALERNEKARRNMVNDVAHELRTPLTNMRVQIEAAQDGVAPLDLESLQEETELLGQLVDDLQQLSLAEAGQLRLEVGEVDVREVIERATGVIVSREGGEGPSEVRMRRSFGVSAPQDDKLTIDVDVPPDLSVNGDARRLVQVVRNLVANAVRYAESHVRISARQIVRAVEIRVADDGPGVADDHVERIFDRFYRADASRSRATGGAGLGLAIVKQLVELHGGSVRYERPAFIIELPS